MRIACVHIPQFALQCATRIDPSLRSERHAPVVIVGPVSVAPSPSHARDGRGAALHSPIVLACSRAAWALGARVGMTATTARTLSPELQILTADAQLERDTLRALADTLLTLSPVVDVGGRVGPAGAHLAIYCEVPPKTRGTTFGERLLDRVRALGVTARIGIADDRFTAWVAASSPPAPDQRAAGAAHAAPHPYADSRHDDTGVTSVPRGGSAAFLAPRPLSLLSITPEVQHMLELLGVRTLGEFAALPAPTVSSRGRRFLESDFQALARGESGTSLRPYSPDAPIREEAVIHASHASVGGLSTPAAIALLAERIALRLAGRGRCAARLDVTIASATGERTVTLSPVRDSSTVLASAESLAEAIGTALGDSTGHEAWRLRVVVTGEALAADAPDAATDTSAAAFTHTAAGGAHTAAASTHTAAASTHTAAAATHIAAAATHTAAVASASTALPTQRTFAIAIAPPLAAAGANAAASATHAAAGAAVPSAEHGSVQQSAHAELDTLAVVLSTTGGAVDRLFGLSSPAPSPRASRSERRDALAHRRTRRGKQRHRLQSSASSVQARLFKF